MDEGERLELAGKLDLAVEAYARAKRWDHAARVAGSLGKNLDAGRYWLEAQRPYEAAVCFRRVGALRECQSALLHVPQNHPRYRDACVHLVTVALILGTPTASVMSFLTTFISSKPANRAEAVTFNQLAEALANEEKFRLASSLYKSVLAWEHDNDDARDGLLRLATLEKAAAARPSAPPAPTAPAAAASAPGAPRPATGARPVAPAPGTPRGSASLSEALVARGRLKQSDLDEYLRSQARPPVNDLALGQGLVDSSKLKAEDLIQTFAELTGIPWISDEKLLAGVSPDAAKALTLEQAEKWTVVPIRLADRHLHVAMRNPRDVELVDKLRFASGVNHITGVFATDYGIRRAIARLYHGQQGFFDVEDQFASGGDPFAGAAAGFSDRFTRTREQQFDTGDLTHGVSGLEPGRGERPSGPLSLPPPGDLDLPPPGSDIDLPPPPAAQLLASRPGQTLAMTAAPVMPEVGDVFAQRYQLLELIGEGGSASVFRALDKELEEPVALKLFRSMDKAESEDVIARFKLELSLSRLLTHPNIVRLFDLGLAAGWRYLTMELLEGTDLNSTLVNHGKPIGLRQGLGWLEQVCAGLKAAHDRGVIHRDIKPHNLFLTADGTVKVMDFGIAKKLHSPGVTVAGMVRGTPEFISPEQINNFSAVTHLTDLYALGATAYTIFTGSPPFVYDELTRLLYAQANTPPVPPRVKNPEIPEALDVLIMRLLEKNPAARPQSAGEVGALFKAIRDGLP